MLKELIVASSPHETKVAILEDDQLAEVYFERSQEHTIAGSIYKGRVKRVLPGMQSAFVDIGLERDAFLYVSDFFEDLEEYDKIVTTVEEKVARMEQEAARSRPTAPPEPEAAPAPVQAAVEAPALTAPVAVEGVVPEGEPAGPRLPGEFRDQDRGRRRRSRRRRFRDRGFPESKYAPRTEVTPPPEPAPPVRPQEDFESIVLPGESLAKYRHLTAPGTSGGTSSETPAPRTEEIPANEEAAVVFGAGPDEEALEHAEPPERERALEQAEPPERERAEQPSAEQAEIAAWVAEIREESRLETAAEEEERGEASLTTPQGVTAEPETQETARREDTAQPVAPGAPGRPPGTPALEGTMAPAPRSRPYRTQPVRVERAAEQAPAPEEQTVEPSAEMPAAPAADTPAPAEASTEPGDVGTGIPARPDGQECPSLPDVAVAEGGEHAPESEQTISTEAEAQPGPDQAKVRGPAERAPFTHRLSRRMRRKMRETGQQARPAAERPERPERPERMERPERSAHTQPLISDLLREGQEIIVQIAKEPLGKKGARITSHVALPGRYIVYMPTVDHVGVSRKIGSDEERQRLKRIIVEGKRDITGGFIVRTAAEGRSEEELRQDIQFLHRSWMDIRAKAERKSAPALLHHDLNLVERILRDQLSENFNAIWVDNEQEYEKILEFVQQFQPSLVTRVKLYTKDAPIFEEFTVQEEINKALKPKVWLKSGGYIVINQTEALVAIDINTGKYVGKTQRLEDTIVKTNVDAINEIVRQIRLRDLGGIIVIDFIDMDERKNRVKVMQQLEEALRHDRAPSKMLAFNDFGLVAITRKRVRQSLERTLCAPCSVCGGSGLLKSPHTVAMEILAEATKLTPSTQRKDITLRVHPEVGRYLKQRDVSVIQEIEEMTHRTVIIKSDPTLHQESFDFN